MSKPTRYTIQNVKQLIENGKLLPLTPVPTTEKNIFRLTEDIEIEISDGTVFLIKEGFEYDGASVPYIFQPLFPKFGIYAYNSFVHDVLYYMLYKSRKFADNEHFIWGCAIGTKELDNDIRHRFLRLFGWIYWNRNIKNPTERALRNRTLIKNITK